MPINIPNNLPAARILQKENIFVMTTDRAKTQDIRPIKMAIVNLMPKKIDTETQLLRVLGNSPLQVEIDLIGMASHESKNVPREHLLSFYQKFDDIKNKKYDGMIVTGAPVELLAFQEVDYWAELCALMDWSKGNVFSVFHICWGAQAALYHHYGVEKYTLPEKLSGIYPHTVNHPSHPLMRGFNDTFFAPHSRYTYNKDADIAGVPDLEILSTSESAGVYIAARRDFRQIFVTGHSEYERDTLAGEYADAAENGLNPKIPVNYFPGNDSGQPPVMNWKAHGTLLFSNWLNFIIYEHTPFDLGELTGIE